MADSRFDNVKYVCWLKVCMSLLFAKEGLEKLTDEWAKKFHEELRRKLGGNVCGLCDVVELKKQWWNSRWQCRTKVCSKWLEEIRRYLPDTKTKIEWDNSDISSLPSKPWECIKLYLTHGYKTVTNASDADIAAILTIFINNSFFGGLIGKTKTTLLNKVKGIRNKIMHSGTLELDEQEMEDDIATIIDLLQCHTNLMTDRKCQEAIARIEELKDGELKVSLHKEYELQSLNARVMATERQIEHSFNLYRSIGDEFKDLNTSTQTIIQSEVNSMETKYRQFVKDSLDVKDEVETISRFLDKFIHAYGIEGVGLDGLFEKVKVIDDHINDVKAFMQRLQACEQRIEELEKKQKQEEKYKEPKLMSYDERVKDADSEDPYNRILDSLHNNLVENMDGGLLVSLLRSNEYFHFHHITLRDIQEQVTTTKKNEMILELVKCNGRDAYMALKICLTTLNQTNLLQKFDKKEIEELGYKEEIDTTLYTSFDKIDLSVERKLPATGSTRPEFMRQKMMSYEERKKDLQCRLLEIYTKNCSKMPIYSLRPHLTRKLDDVYVKQAMVEKSLQGPTKPQPYNASRFEDKQENKKVQTLKDVFFKESTLCKNIYVTGEAGVGKSTFCVHLVNVWIQAQSGTHDTDSSDSNTMKRFPLLFYINLRGVKLDSDSDIVNIIEQQWKLGSIDEFLENDQCLIIADGLDESVSGEPKRGIMNNSTILITTRPWKLEALRNFVEGDNIDKQVEIVSLDEGSAETLAEKVLPILAEESASKSVKSSKVFISEMKDKSLEAFLKVPMLLIQMLCLWHDDISIGNSNYSIYESLVHHQIMVYIRSKNNTVTISSSDKNSPSLCKKSNCPCKNFSDIISKVGKLALKALVSENRENELVFDHSTTTLHGLCEQDVETCLRIGILSQHKLFGKITELEKYISFVHKTYQEFFASLYLSYKVPISEIESVLNTAIYNLDRMLELEKLLMFVSGLNPEMGRKMADLLLDAADQDPRIQEYRQTVWGWLGSRHDKLVSNIQTAILAASAECNQHQHQQQFRLDDVRVNKDNMSGVLSCLPAGSQVTSISMRCDDYNYLPTDGVMRLTNTSRLQKVHLYSCTISGASLSQVVPSSLCALYLDDVRMSHAALESLGSRLSAAVNLRRVWLGWLECETHGRLDEGRCAPLSLDFSSHVGLEELFIGVCEMSSCRMEPGMGKLEEVILGYITTTAAILKQLVDSLPGNNVEVRLWEVTIRHEAGAASPAAILHDIRQSCRVEEDYVERRENGDLYVNMFVFYK